MSSAQESDRVLVEQVRAGATDAWQQLIDRYEGRVHAYLRGRLSRTDQVDDLVQETLIGFLHSLPNYDTRRSLESYLLSIAAHKLTDYMRREGRRPTMPLAQGDEGTDWEPPSPGRAVSSICRSGEQQQREEQALGNALKEQIQYHRERGEWEKIKVAELLFVRGWANKDVANELGLTEQKIANLKFEFVAKLKSAIQRMGLSAELVPEA